MLLCCDILSRFLKECLAPSNNSCGLVKSKVTQSDLGAEGDAPSCQIEINQVCSMYNTCAGCTWNDQCVWCNSSDTQPQGFCTFRYGYGQYCDLGNAFGGLLNVLTPSMCPPPADPCGAMSCAEVVLIDNHFFPHKKSQCDSSQCDFCANSNPNFPFFSCAKKGFFSGPSATAMSVLNTFANRCPSPGVTTPNATLCAAIESMMASINALAAPNQTIGVLGALNQTISSQYTLSPLSRQSTTLGTSANGCAVVPNMPIQLGPGCALDLIHWKITCAGAAGMPVLALPGAVTVNTLAVSITRCATPAVNVAVGYTLTFPDPGIGVDMLLAALSPPVTIPTGLQSLNMSEALVNGQDLVLPVRVCA
jgi:hypothetical protein